MNVNRPDNELADLNEFIAIPRQAQKENNCLLSEECYANNIAALAKHHPELVEMIDSLVIDENRIQILSSESGNPRVVYKKEDGEDVNIHSSVDPAECANQAIDLLGKIDKEGIVVLFGFGFGYFAEEIFRRFEKGHILIVYEAIPEIFKLALMTRDISQLLDSEKIKIVLGSDAGNFSVIHIHHHLILNGKFWIVQHKPSVMLDQKAYDNFMKRLNEEKGLSDLGVATVIARGKEFMDAFIENVPSIIRRQGVHRLKDIFKGRPALIVSAGPSLDRNMHLLKKVKGKAVIIATDASLPSLLSADIIPDLAVAIDPVSDNMEDKFKDIPVLKDLPFVCLAQYTPELVRMYPGLMFINSVPHNIAYQWLSGYWEDKGYIETFGGSVAHLAFSTAEFTGADVIAFVGQDLSFSGKRVHTIGYSDNLDRMLKASPEKESNNVPGETTALDIFNETVHTIRQFTTFKTSFENKIKNYSGKVFNLTEAGLPIDGAVNMRFIDFIDIYCNGLQEIDTYSMLSVLSVSDNSFNLDGLINEVTFARDKYIEIKKTSRQILKIIKRAKVLKKQETEDSPELNSLLRKVSHLIEKAKHPVLNILTGYHYGLELYLKKQEIQEIDEIEDKWKKLDKQLIRGSSYYTEIVNAIVLFNKHLDKLVITLKMEKEIDSILNNEAIDQDKKYYRAGMLYKKNGMVAQAVKYLETVLNSQEPGSDSSEILLLLAEMYLKQYRFYEARELLDKAGSLKPVNRNEGSHITELLRTCNRKINEWEARRKKMDNLLKEAAEYYGSHLESGYFYLRIKDFKRAEKAYLKAIEDRQVGATLREDPLQEARGKGQEALSSAYYGLAHTYLAQDDPEKAVEALGKAIEIEPGNPVFYRDLGYISFNNNNIASAELFFTKAIDLSPKTGELYKPLADLYLCRDEREKAIGLYEKAMKVNPDDPVIQHELAMVLNETISAARS